MDGYGCYVRSFTPESSDDKEITSIIGQHQSGKTDDDVDYFYAPQRIANLNVFPRNLKKFYKNMNLLWINHSSIKKITKSDMESAGDKLTRFYFYSNKLEVLEAGTFDFNVNLEKILLSSNRIKIIERGVFNNLPKLAYLDLNNNLCHSDYADDRASVTELIAEIEGKCVEAPQSPNFISKFNEMSENFSKVFQQMRNLEEKLAAIEGKMDSSKNLVDEKLSDVTTTCSLLNNKLNMITEKRP